MAHRRVKDAALLFRLWHDETLKITDIASELGVAESTVSATAKRFGLRRRDVVVRERREIQAVAEIENLATCEDLKLDSWTEERARPIREGWSEDERYQRRVTKVQPICYGGMYS